MGILAATVANSHRSKKTKPFKPSDFIPKYGKISSKAQSIDEMKSVLLNLVEVTKKPAAQKARR